ncbi:nucleolin-like [Pseudomyrmex gracilis]|uniref:nucleolin-like n=1 Tax=Pseudomyrmex gracilis TaxID=219809 RepID=UPI0009953AC2|nr:nucleolin-like [Pseudomyrmex gracilis]
MKKIKDVSDDDEFEVDDPDDPEEGPSEEEWTPEADNESAKVRPQRGATKKRHHSEEEEEEEDEEEEEEDDEEEEESDSDSGRKPKRKRSTKKEEDDDDEDSEENSEQDGEHPKNFQSGSFVISKEDLEVAKKNKNKNISEVDKYPNLWRIDGKALLQKYLPFQDKSGKILYKSTTTYSGWQISNKHKYVSLNVSLKSENRQEAIAELTAPFDPAKFLEEAKSDKEED